MTPGNLEAELREVGFLAPTLGPFSRYIKERLEEWFNVAEDLNRLGQRAYFEGTKLLPGLAMLDPVFLALLMTSRSLGAFQGALILAQKGMGNEAQSLIRTVFECVFWIGYLRNEPETAVKCLVYDSIFNDAGLHKAALKHLRPSGPARTQLEFSLGDLQERIAQGKFPAPKTEELARLSGYEGYYYFYKDLSGYAAHTSLKAMHSIVDHDGEGNIIGHQFGPDEDSTERAIWLGCLGMVRLIDAVTTLASLDGFEPELGNLNSRVEELEPGHLQKG